MQPHMQLATYYATDLFDGLLHVRSVPGDPLVVVTAIFSELIIIWARDPNGMGLAANPLRGNSDASMFLLIFC